MTATVRLFLDPAALGLVLAQEIMAGIAEAHREGRPFVLGCPGGRSGRTTYQALARLSHGADLGHVIVAMMDDYVEPGQDGLWRPVPSDAHYSCRRFASHEIVAPINAAAARGIPPTNVWLPDPTDPTDHGRRLAEAGGVDHFLVASGASDGHVGFVRPGTSFATGDAIIALADSTRRDNMATFPDFTSLDQVPTHGVSVGLSTIAELSRRVTLVLHGTDKRDAARRVLAATDHDPEWPATFVHRCRDARIFLDEAAIGRA
jgi:glucosamine-6-phosphate deaminase